MYIRDKNLRPVILFIIFVVDLAFLYAIVMSFGGMWRLPEHEQALWIIPPSTALFLSVIGFIGMMIFTYKTISKN